MSETVTDVGVIVRAMSLDALAHLVNDTLRARYDIGWVEEQSRVDQTTLFFCPRCEVDVRAGGFRRGRYATEHPSAWVHDERLWACHRDGLHTRYELERLLLDSPLAIGLLAAQ